ncbi:MIP/aquaporin family protein [Nocardioides litoris]|uniref:MIP/aquaporin family protein n=1 Tax=Nocardioides litoris TaxID=1926648 RepID=UPI0014773B4C|nr:aquaporin [Nocardioides litoris]
MSSTAATGASTAPPTTAHKLAAEAIGTFVVVAAAVAGFGAFGDGVGVNTTAVAFAVVAVTYAFGRLSGGHFNPALSLGSALAGRTAWAEAGLLVGAQVAGALVAAVLTVVTAFGGSDSYEFFETGLGGNGYGDDATGFAFWAAILVTLVATAALVLVFLALTDRRNEQVAFAPIGIGLATFATLSATSAVTGGSVNPAQSLGLGLISGVDPLVQGIVLIIGMVLGAAGAGALYPALFGADRDPVPGAGLNFSKPAGQGAPAGYAAQQWGQPAAGGYGAGGYQQQSYAPPVTQTGQAPAVGQSAQAGQHGQVGQVGQVGQAGQHGGHAAQAGQGQQAEQPIIQDGWQWDPQAQQWIPAQQQAPSAQQGGWGAATSEQTQVRPPDGA